MFQTEVKVKGSILKGQITGNWSKIRLSEISNSTVTFSESDLDELVKELTAIRDKVVEMNSKHSKLTF